MPGKPHNTSFPEKAFTVKDGKSLNSESEGLNSASIFTVSSTANFFCWPAIATDSLRDAFPSESTHYVSFSIAGDSPRRTSIHSHSIINNTSKALPVKPSRKVDQFDTIENTIRK
ncbi:hypothetical protein [Burkholderia multivorans]|uniref:hypothetical protein n=1 Tax=Burkholderia multivorans TaxID=87883 RepID=UPI001C22D26F|nr:hypothetical protein [Burkholderia multivorans]MBU9413482.1 hypothetical protein [Burkholderia multivorans]